MCKSVVKSDSSSLVSEFLPNPVPALESYLLIATCVHTQTYPYIHRHRERERQTDRQRQRERVIHTQAHEHSHKIK